MIDDWINKWIFPIALTIGILLGGFSVLGFESFKHNKQLRDIQEQVIKQQEINNKTVIDLQNKNSISEASYNTLKDKLNALPTITNVPCKLTNNAVKLWNQSKGTEGKLPTDSSRAVEASNTSNPPDTNNIEGVGIKLVLDNALANDKICNGLRSQIESIIKWDLDTYGK